MLIDEIAGRARRAGIDPSGMFDLEPRSGDGDYAMQQAPEELARLTCLLASQGPFAWGLEIGVASGGTTRFLREHVAVEQTAVIDDGRHPDAALWDRHKEHVPGLCEFRGDSGSPDAARFLTGLGTRFDLAGIDADHGERAVLRDWRLVRPFLRGGAVVWLHDIHECGGVAVLWRKLRRRYPVLLETGGLGIGVIRYGGP